MEIPPPKPSADTSQPNKNHKNSDLNVRIILEQNNNPFTLKTIYETAGLIDMLLADHLA